MQRRPRIKAVANLSASRRAAIKSYSDSQSKTSELKNDSEKSLENSQPEQECGAEEDLFEATTSKVEMQSDLLQKKDEQMELEKVAACEKLVELKMPEQAKTDLKLHYQIDCKSPCLENPTTFKAPPQMQRNEKEPAGSSHSNTNKFKKFKIAPRLTALRNVVKSQASK